MDNIIHKFEKAGLGKAPFRIVGFEQKTYQACLGAPMQVGGSCDYCGTGIVDMFWLRGIDNGEPFKVGSSCVYKTGDAGLIIPAKNKINALKRQARHQKEAILIEELKALLIDYHDRLSSLPHPRGFTDRQTDKPLTYLDQANWLMANAGNAGKLTLLKDIKKQLQS